MSDQIPTPAVAAMLAGVPELQREWERTAPGRAVAAALAELRRGWGLSQSEVARAAGWDQAFVSRLEAGRGSTPTLETIARYVRICGGTPRLHIASSDGTDVVVDLTLFAPDTEPAVSDLADARRTREREINLRRQDPASGEVIDPWPFADKQGEEMRRAYLRKMGGKPVAEG